MSDADTESAGGPGGSARGPGVKDLVEYIARSLVDQPDEVEVVQVGKGMLELRVADDDRGKIIGRKGRTAHAIRSLIAAVDGTDDPPSLEIVD